LVEPSLVTTGELGFRSASVVSSASAVRNAGWPGEMLILSRKMSGGESRSAPPTPVGA